MSNQGVAILNARGTFYKVLLSTTFSPSMYAVAGLNVPDPTTTTTNQNITAANQADTKAIQSLQQQQDIINKGIATANANLTAQTESYDAAVAADPGDISQSFPSGKAPALNQNTASLAAQNVASNGIATSQKQIQDYSTLSASFSSQIAQKQQSIKDRSSGIIPTPDLTNFPILISGIATSKMDIISLVSCLNNAKVIYTFGQNFGTVAIRGEVLLGPSGTDFKPGVQQLEDFFQKYRVSVSQQPMQFSIGNNASYAYLDGMEIAEVITDFHILPFVLHGTLLDISRNDTSKINPSGLVITAGNLSSSTVIQALNQRSSPLQVSTATTVSNSTSSPLPAAPAAGAVSPTSNNQGQMTDASAIAVTKQATGQPLSNDEQELQSMTAQYNALAASNPIAAQAYLNSNAAQMSQLQSTVVANQGQGYTVTDFSAPKTSSTNSTLVSPAGALGSTLPAESSRPTTGPAGNNSFLYK